MVDKIDNNNKHRPFYDYIHEGKLHNLTKYRQAADYVDRVKAKFEEQKEEDKKNATAESVAEKEKAQAKLAEDVKNCIDHITNINNNLKNRYDTLRNENHIPDS